MTAAADLVLTDAEVHTLSDPDAVHEAVAVRDGQVVRVGSSYEVGFLVGVETRVRELGGRVVLPGFADAHTHLIEVGRRERAADLAGASDADEAVARLRERAGEKNAADSGGDATGGWLLGYGYDDTVWDRPLRKRDLDRASDRPVAVFREDMHAAVLNDEAFDRHRDAMADGDVETAGGDPAGGDPTGVVVEDAVDVVQEVIAPDRAEARDLIAVARDRAHERGVTAVHDKVPGPTAAAAYRELDREGDLRLRVRLDHAADRLDDLAAAGVVPDHGSAFVEVGAAKLFADGSLGSHTARLREPYADAGGHRGAGGTDGRGRWATPPDELAALVERADDAGFQVAIHAIGDAAIEAALDACEDVPAARRPRIEHAELADDDQIERLAASGAVASVQPNFHRWAGEGGLYERRLGPERRDRTNRLGAYRDAGVRLAFGSDCMPLDPLFGVHHAVNAPTLAQRVDVTEALRAYTGGAAYAGFDEGRIGEIAPGYRADLVALERSPWENPGAISGIGVTLTVVDGEVVHDTW